MRIRIIYLALCLALSGSLAESKAAESSRTFDLVLALFEKDCFQQASPKRYQHWREAHLAHLAPFANWLNKNKLGSAGLKIRILQWADAAIFNQPLLILEGAYGIEPTEAEKKNLRMFVERGGFLFVEDCGGRVREWEKYGRFANQIKELLKGVFPDGKWEVLPKTHEIYRVPYCYPADTHLLMEKDSSGWSCQPERKWHHGEGFFWNERLVAFFSTLPASYRPYEYGEGFVFKGKEQPDDDTAFPANCLIFQGETISWGERKGIVDWIPYRFVANVIVYAMTH
ncbi:MAG: DUF4159 domain-containing protein [Verrucomicrobiae bacterium]|nr:DUF4159 domain-containing protein [Verrucomicrobiae bacterium]